MPQIFAVLGPGTLALFTKTDARALGQSLIDIVDKVLHKKKGTTFTAVQALETEGETDFQVEIRYKLEDFVCPPEELARLVEGKFYEFMSEHRQRDYTLSVRCIQDVCVYYRVSQLNQRKEQHS